MPVGPVDGSTAAPTLSTAEKVTVEKIVQGLNQNWGNTMLTVGEDGSVKVGFGGDLALTLPLPAIDIETLTGELTDIHATFSNLVGFSQNEMYQLHKEQRKEAMLDAMKKLQEFADKHKQALEDQKKQSIANWFKAVITLVGAVAAAFTLGALSGGAFAVALTGAIVGAVMALMDVANQVVKETPQNETMTGVDGKTKALEISIAAMCEAIAAADPECQKLPPEERAKRLQGATIATTVLLTLVVMAGGLASCEAALVPCGKVAWSVIKGKETASLGDAIAAGTTEITRVQSVAEVVTNFADFSAGMSTITVGILEFFISEAEMDANLAKAQQDFWQEMGKQLSKYMEREGKGMTDTVKNVNDRLADISDMVKDFFTAKYLVQVAA